MSINRLASFTGKPGQVIGIRFFRLIDKGALIELVAGHQTSDYALAVAIDYVRKIRKTPIVVSDSPGGYVLRCLTAYADEGQQALREGVNPELIERASKMAGMAISPLDTRQELSGMNTATRIDTREQLDSLTKEQPTLDEIKTRLLYRQVIEAVRCFDANVVSTKLEADLGSLLGWGFPSYTGGALSFIDFVSTDTFIKTADRLADTYGERFRPTEKLQRWAN